VCIKKRDINVKPLQRNTLWETNILVVAFRCCSTEVIYGGNVFWEAAILLSKGNCFTVGYSSKRTQGSTLEGLGAP
jgi:hypothetical protein